MDAKQNIDFSGLAPAQPAEPSAKQQEGFWRAFDGKRLFWQTWEPEEDPPKAVVSLIHGYGEHSSRYDHFATALTRVGIAVIAIDMRGHGRSTGDRGHIESFDNYIEDISLLDEHASERWSGVPRFCLGHSNGGLALLSFASRVDSDLEGFVFSSPFCGFAVQIPFWKVWLGNMMSKTWPNLTLPSEVEGEQVSHLQRVVETYDSDPLNHQVATARWFTEAQRTQEAISDEAHKIQKPVLFLLAGADKVADSEAAEDIFHELGSPDKELEIYPNLFHELLSERDWKQITRRIVSWIKGQI